jgi:hypothetical protein
MLFCPSVWGLTIGDRILRNHEPKETIPPLSYVRYLIMVTLK